MSERTHRAVGEREAAGIIAAAARGRVDVATHVSPDADTLGCALAFWALINENGGDAALVCPDRVPEYLRFLTEGVEIEIRDTLREGAFRLAVDVAAPRQLGALSGESFDLMIDHHGTGEPFCDHVVEADAAACGEIVHRIIKLLRDEHGLRVPGAVPTYLYAAISGDTGSFRFSNTTSQTHRVAAELHELGADTVRVARKLHSEKTLSELRALRLGLTNMKLYYGGRLAITSATARELSENMLSQEDFSEADEMRSVAGTLVGAALRESSPGQWRVSTRSSSEAVDCAAVCAAFGGGGHKGAAGCTVYADTRERAVEIVVEAFAEALF